MQRIALRRVALMAVESPVMDASKKPANEPATLGHGGRVLPAVTVDAYNNEELRDEDGFVGDCASGRAFRAILDDRRDQLLRRGEDPFDGTPTGEIPKFKLDAYLKGADPYGGVAKRRPAIAENDIR